MHPSDTKACFTDHCSSLYAMEPLRLRAIVSQIRAGLAKERVADSGLSPTYQREQRVAIIPIHGSITKKRSKFSDNSAIELRSLVRQASRDETIDKIILHIDSPGGAVEGISDLADEIFAAKQKKPVVAYCEDLCASAGYWIASQCSEIVSNKGGWIGSLGVYGVIEDWSAAYEREGVIVHVISSGGVKGGGVPGTEVTDSLIKDEQRVVDQITRQFMDAVREGRKLTHDKTQSLFDGKVHPAEDAVKLGLIDRVASFDEVLAGSKEQNMTEQANIDAILPEDIKKAMAVVAEDAPPFEKKKDEDEEDEEEDEKKMKAAKLIAEAQATLSNIEQEANEYVGALVKSGHPLSASTLKRKLMAEPADMEATYARLVKLGKAASVGSNWDAPQPKQEESEGDNFESLMAEYTAQEAKKAPSKSEAFHKSAAIMRIEKEHPGLRAAYIASRQ